MAHNLLKLVASLLEPERSSGLKSEPAYKNICAIRSHLVRHAYDKPSGDPYGGFAWNEERGPILDGGSPFGRHRDPGFNPNAAALEQLFSVYEIDLLAFPWLKRFSPK